MSSQEGFFHNGRIVYLVMYTLTTGEGIVVRLDRDGNDLNGARHDDAARRIVTTKPGERIWALGEWHTVAGVAVHSAVPLAPQPLPFTDDDTARR
jgi:hypothetical protein